MPDTQVKAEFDPTVQRMIGTATHGGGYFNVPFISEISDTLWQGGVGTGAYIMAIFILLILPHLHWTR